LEWIDTQTYLLHLQRARLVSHATFHFFFLCKQMSFVLIGSNSSAYFPQHKTATGWIFDPFYKCMSSFSLSFRYSYPFFPFTIIPFHSLYVSLRILHLRRTEMVLWWSTLQKSYILATMAVGNHFATLVGAAVRGCGVVASGGDALFRSVSIA
jgi:hypothetical protein